MAAVHNADLLSTVLAERAIRQTFFLYFRLCDTHQWERVARECFTPDAEVTFTARAQPRHTLRGREEIHNFYRSQYGDANETGLERMAHVAGQTVIDWTDGIPTMRASVTAWRWFRSSSAGGDRRPADEAVIAFSEEDYAEVDDGAWLVARRHVNYHGTAVGRPSA